jgi:CRISPR-associated endoribonuclease Cas6
VGEVGGVVMKLIRASWLLSISEPALLPRAYGLALIQDLHDKMQLALGDRAIPNIACSGLVGKVSFVEDFVSLSADVPYQLILCGLDVVATQAIMELDLGDTLKFLGVEFSVQREPDEVTSYEQLYYGSIVLEPALVNRHRLKFLTPTAFSQNRKYLPLPLPSLMFRSWLERWNHFAEVYLGGDELLEYLDRSMALQQLRIQTQPMAIQRSKIPGFMGSVQLNILSSDPLLGNVASLLLQYSRFCGTGIKTRLGMGATDYIVPNSKQSNSGD